MEKIIEFLRDGFESIFNIVTTVLNAFKSLLNILKVCMSYVGDVLSILPEWMYALLIILVTVCIIYKFLGREGDS